MTQTGQSASADATTQKCSRARPRAAKGRPTVFKTANYRLIIRYHRVDWHDGRQGSLPVTSCGQAPSPGHRPVTVVEVLRPGVTVAHTVAALTAPR